MAGRNDLPKKRELVVKTKKWGSTVFVSPIAEEGREKSCLCIHTNAKGKIVMCERLKNNLHLEKHFTLTHKMHMSSLKHILAMTDHEGSIFNALPIDSPCPVAAILYAIAQGVPMAMSISVCAGYVPPKGQAILDEGEKGGKK